MKVKNETFRICWGSCRRGAEVLVGDGQVDEGVLVDESDESVKAVQVDANASK